MTEALLDPPAFRPEEVFRDYAPRIFHLARRMLGNDADAEDVTQEVLLQVIRKIHTFRGDAALSTWLHRVTVNAALAHREKRANITQREGASTEEATLHTATEDTRSVRLKAPPAHVTPDEVVLADEQRQLIESAMNKLPESYRDVYVLADVEGLPNQEIAELLGLSLAAVKSRLHRARLQMRELLAPHFEEVAT